MRISNATGLAAAALGFVGLAAHAATAQTANDETYEWSAALMSVDESAGTAVFQARFESYVNIDGLDTFEEGDRLTLIWTGRRWAAGIRDLAEDPELTPDTLSLPVEFVSTARDEQYLNFRIRLPASAVDELADFEAGTRVTGISPKMATEWDSAVLSVRHYNDIS